jgi:glycosyltransferase involved in cell wall biosynthesis
VKNDSKDISYVVYCSAVAYSKNERLKFFYNAELIYLPISANGLSSIFYDILSIIHALSKAKVHLILGVSGAIVLPFLRFFFPSHKFITHIDGMEWKRKKWGGITQAFLKFSEMVAVQYSNAIIADNQAIVNYVSVTYRKKSSLLTYGADHHKYEPSHLTEDYAFSVCRIEPENNVHIILQAFSEEPGITLKFIGNWKNSKYGKDLFKKYSSYKNLELLDAVYDQSKLDKIRGNCMLYIHGHSAGGTNPSLVEAMYLELPILAFDVSYNRYTTNNEALYFKNEQELLEMLKKIQLIDLKSIATKMKEYADANYVWDKVVKEYIEVFCE